MAVESKDKIIVVDNLATFLEEIRKEIGQTQGVTYTFEQDGTTLKITGSDGYYKEIALGEDITAEKITTALGYTPADEDDVITNDYIDSLFVTA